MPACRLPLLPLALLALAAGYAGSAAQAAEPARPNIVFVLIDSVRADHLGCYGYGRPTSPFLDSLAAEGVLFSHYFANSSWTGPAVANLFTGLSSLRHRRNNPGDPIPDHIPTLAETLRGSGYRTLAVTCNPVAGSQWGYQRGFDVFDDFTIPLYIETDLVPDGRNMDADTRHRNLVASPALDDRMVAIALRLARGVPEDRSFFLFIQMYDPHWDYSPLPEYRDMFADPAYSGSATGEYAEFRKTEGVEPAPGEMGRVIDLYDAEIRQADDAIRRLVTALRERGQLKETDVLVISADHGEEFMEHGVVSHGKNLFEPAVKVPCVVVAPGRLPKGAVADLMASHVDWLPTLAAFAGAAAPEGLPGENLFQFADGRWAPPDREGVFMHTMLDEPPFARPMVALRTKDAKVIRHLDDGSAVAYDLAADPGERQPLAIGGNAVLEAMLARLDRWHEGEIGLAGAD